MLDLRADNRNLPLPSAALECINSAASGSVIEYAPIIFDDYYDRNLYDLKNAKVCMSLTFAKGVGKLGMVREQSLCIFHVDIENV